MIDFACKEFDLDDIVKCGLGLTRAEFQVMGFLIKDGQEMSAAEVAGKTGLDLTTIQKAVKKLAEKGIVSRSQKNLGGGGYLFLYQAKPRPAVRQVLKDIIRRWSRAVEDRIDEW
ncbi:MAG: MarR family transcriptional regulator [Candidatus Micrarchaeota archaeon]